MRGLTRPPPISPVEYWSFLAVAGVLALAFLLPPRTKSCSPSNPGSGAFGSSSDDPRVVRQKTHDTGRGRHADAPWEIPLLGWRDILWRTYRKTMEDRLLAVAAGVVFYGLLALFPATTALVSLYGLFANSGSLNDQFASLSSVLPNNALDILREQIGHLTAQPSAKLGMGLAIGLGVTLWSANAGMKAIIDALNVVYGEKEKRGFIKLNLVSFAFTVVALASVLVALGAVVVLPLILNQLGLASITDALISIARWPILLGLVIIGLSLIYRFGPSRREPRWQWLAVGSVFAAVVWLVTSGLLSSYLATYAHYDVTYGSLGAGIGLMMWMWISTIVILFGAQLNSEIEHQTVKDSTIGHDKTLGTRGALMADTVGEAVS